MHSSTESHEAIQATVPAAKKADGRSREARAARHRLNSLHRGV